MSKGGARAGAGKPKGKGNQLGSTVRMRAENVILNMALSDKEIGRTIRDAIFEVGFSGGQSALSKKCRAIYHQKTAVFLNKKKQGT